MVCNVVTNVFYLNKKHDLVHFKIFYINILAFRPDCEYGLWEEWSPCSYTCGEGRRTRRREQLNFDCRPTNKAKPQQELCNNGECQGM